MQNSPKDLRKKILGRSGEDAAVRYLKQSGYEILERNYRTPFGEADIIARKGETVCFVEVKTRTSEEFGAPYEAVDRRKRERYFKIALFYCNRLGREPACRFDVASIFDGELTYYENAYEKQD